MQWKQLWNMPSEGSLWMLRHAGKWLQDAGRMELEQWTGDFGSEATANRSVGAEDTATLPVATTEDLV